MDSPKLNEKVHKASATHTGAISKRQVHQNDHSKDDLEASTVNFITISSTDI